MNSRSLERFSQEQVATEMKRLEKSKGKKLASLGVWTHTSPELRAEHLEGIARSELNERAIREEKKARVAAKSERKATGSTAVKASAVNPSLVGGGGDDIPRDDHGRFASK